MVRHLLYIIVLVLLAPRFVSAQRDTTPINVDSILLSKKGIIGELAQVLLTDTSQPKQEDMQRVDKSFQKYRYRIIRNIDVVGLDFGVSLDDTSKGLKNSLTRLADAMHVTTRPFAIRNQLFFKEYDRVSPYLFANNERYLRDLPYLRDARIVIRPVKGYPDSVDVTVFVKDVLSIGGEIDVSSYQKARVQVREDNFLGYGDRLQFQTLFDRQRHERFGFGAAYLKRNVLGSFIDLEAGYLDFNPAFNSGLREERVSFLRMVRPLANPKSRWTYSANVEWHETANMFNSDSVYEMDWSYAYRLQDAWLGWNPSWRQVGTSREASSLRYFAGLRVIQQDFTRKPMQYSHGYNYSFADLFAVLGSVAIYRQNFYKTQYIYGFGRNEDLPQGIDASITGGFTKKDSIKRPYLGLNWNLNFVTSSERFFNFAVAAGSSFYKKEAQDIAMLGSAEYFGKLHIWKNKWKQRLYMMVNAAKQINSTLDEPLYMESAYALPDYDNAWLPGHSRATLLSEWLFYAPKAAFFFKFAPFVSGSVTYFKTVNLNPRLIPVLGGGLRVRNESLIFGTMEIRGNYFPKQDMQGNRWAIMLRSNLRYKFNQNFIRRPEFVKLNQRNSG